MGEAGNSWMGAGVRWWSGGGCKTERASACGSEDHVVVARKETKDHFEEGGSCGIVGSDGRAAAWRFQTLPSRNMLHECKERASHLK